jgi:hypothetical protein
MLALLGMRAAAHLKGMTMSLEWANRQRRTNALVRLIARHVLQGGPVTAEQLYGICKLTWITSSFDGEAVAYIQSTKIPALGSALSRDYTNWTLEEVAKDVADTIESEELIPLVQHHTGFTNFYKPYRNSCRQWIERHHHTITRLFERALNLTTDSDGLELAKEIQSLPGVPKANVKGQLMRPEYAITPVLFSLDERVRFPLINGNEGVQALLSALGVANASLKEQYERMVALYGEGGINDAADLDQVGHDLPEFIVIGMRGPTKKLLDRKQTEGNALPLKDEADIEALQQSRTITHRRLHNVLTNQLREMLFRYTLLEGADSSALFDVLVKKYNSDEDDLLIEAKSCVDAPNIRMAIGQLFDYWFRIKGDKTPHLAILTPHQPDPKVAEMLDWLKIGILWTEGDRLHTSSKWLTCLCDT